MASGMGQCPVPLVSPLVCVRGLLAPLSCSLFTLMTCSLFSGVLALVVVSMGISMGALVTQMTC